MKEKTNILLFFLLFIIIFISVIYYPLFSIEYFNNNNNFNIQQFIHLDKYTIDKTNKYIDKENNYNDYLENLEFSPNCCPSLITSSTGCACFDKSITSLICSRGNNKKY